MTNFELALDGLVAILLVATIVYAVILNRKLQAFRQGKEEFEAIVGKLNTAIDHAGRATVELRQLSETEAVGLDQAVKSASALRDDLSFLVERGGVIADRLESGVKGSRGMEPVDVSQNVVDSAAGHADRAGVERVDFAEDAEKTLRQILDATR